MAASSSLSDQVRDTDTVGKSRPHRLKFDHTTVSFEYGPVGVIARIDYHEKPVVRYAGPLPKATIDALSEVAHDV